MIIFYLFLGVAAGTLLLSWVLLQAMRLGEAVYCKLSQMKCNDDEKRESEDPAPQRKSSLS